MFHVYLRSNRVYDVVSLLFADSTMSAGIIGHEAEPEDGPEATSTSWKQIEKGP